MGLLIIPMTLFQMSSASLDGISTALALLALSAFLRLTTDKDPAQGWLLPVLAGSIFLVASSRMHLFPMVFLIFGVFFYTKDKKSLMFGSLVTFLLMTWFFIVMLTVVNGSVWPTPSISKSFFYYSAHPLYFFRAVFNTCSDFQIMSNYYKEFIGVLGWVNSRSEFPKCVYDGFLVFLAFLLLCSISLSNFRSNWSIRAWLFMCGVLSILFIFFALMLVSSPQPAMTITGIQGRYFLIPAIMLAYSLCLNEEALGKYRNASGWLALIVLSLFSVQSTATLLLKKYYIPLRAASHWSIFG
jgi:uncharacterized membrane protein